MTVKRIDWEAYKKKKQELLNQIFEEKNRHCKSTYTLIVALYDLELQHNPKYTAYQLAKETYFSEGYIYTILRYRDSPETFKKLVDDNKIDFSKALRLLRGNKKSVTNEPELLKLADKVIKNNMSYDAVQDMVVKRDEETIKSARKERTGSNLYRDIMLYITKMKVALYQIKKLPNTNHKAVKEQLIILRGLIDNAIKKLD
jgi:hypothetical protein